jgi:hypothetical protein
VFNLFFYINVMRKVLVVLALLGVIVSCSNDAPLNQQEENAVDSLVNNEQQAMDSLEAAIKAQIGTDSLGEEGAE